MGVLCNLAIEFNGLVSTKGWKKFQPFYFLSNPPTEQHFYPKKTDLHCYLSGAKKLIVSDSIMCLENCSNHKAKRNVQRIKVNILYLLIEILDKNENPMPKKYIVTLVKTL